MSAPPDRHPHRAPAPAPPDEEPRLRLFVAVAPPPEVREALHAVAAPLREAGGRALSWTRAGQLHLTLRFLGDTPERLAGPLAAALRSAAAATPAFDLRVGGAGAFPGWTRPRVLWLGLTSHAPGTGEGADPPANDALARLYHAVDSTCAALGLGRESRPFRAHLTLGRVRPGARPDIGALRAVGAALPALPAFPIRTLDLMASELAPTGAIHTCLAALPLAGAPHEPGAAAPGAR